MVHCWNSLKAHWQIPVRFQILSRKGHNMSSIVKKISGPTFSQVLSKRHGPKGSKRWWKELQPYQTAVLVKFASSSCTFHRLLASWKGFAKLPQKLFQLFTWIWQHINTLWVFPEFYTIKWSLKFWVPVETLKCSAFSHSFFCIPCNHKSQSWWNNFFASVQLELSLASHHLANSCHLNF